MFCYSSMTQTMTMPLKMSSRDYTMTALKWRPFWKQKGENRAAGYEFHTYDTGISHLRNDYQCQNWEKFLMESLEENSTIVGLPLSYHAPWGSTLPSHDSQAAKWRHPCGKERKAGQWWVQKHDLLTAATVRDVWDAEFPIPNSIQMTMPQPAA